MKITITKKEPAACGGTWYTGWTGAWDFQAKVYDTDSKYGISGGRVSKLTIASKATGRVVARYDRGWDILPDAGDMATLAEIHRLEAALFYYLMEE